MLVAGQLFAERFQVIKHEGDGGSAAVFRSFDQKENTQVALKVFREDGPNPAITTELWNREAEALLKMSHNCIIRLVEAGRCKDTGARYIATEWVEGTTLHDELLKTGALGWRPFMDQFGDRLLDAICHVYEQNVAHRDLSPKNVLVGRDGSLKLIDFGLAKLTNIGIGRTVSNWKTPPYCPPEDDTGRHTLTRDPYSFAAIIVRAMHGSDLADHDALYDALESLKVDDTLKGVLRKALSRDPGARFQNIVSFREAIGAETAAALPDDLLTLPIRFVPSAFKLESADAEAVAELEAAVLAELNEACAVQLLAADQGPTTRLNIETASFRLRIDVNTPSRDHLVVTSVVPKRLSIETLYRRGSWIPAIALRTQLPRTAAERDRARAAIELFYRRAEEELSRATAIVEHRGDAFLTQWSRVLEAMKEMERTRLPPARYHFLEVVGRRLFVELENPADAREGQFRAIARTQGGRWIFRGEIESIEGRKCCIYSKHPFIAAEEIPNNGTLEHDWSREQRALDRQAAALETFRAKTVPSERLRQLVLMEQAGATELKYKAPPTFFDTSLNDEKKALVAAFLANEDLLLIQGPPGTGKTKVIVELIRQELRRNPNAKILLAAQTHGALDHALYGVVKGDPTIAAIRISSGGKEMSGAVKHCSADARGLQLQEQVAQASERFLREKATVQKIDYDELLLGVRAAEVLTVRRRIAISTTRCNELEVQIGALRAQQERSTNATTTKQHDEGRARLQALTDDLDRESDDLALLKSQQKMSELALTGLSSQGRSLVKLPDDELTEWCELFLEGPGRADLRQLIELAEDWRLKFTKSDDFKAAIIATSSLIAGTCVGFSGEPAAISSTYDLCIVDESSKATSTELLLPLSRCRRAVLVGDHHQLPPFVEFALKSHALVHKYGFSPDVLEAQLFETLQDKLAAGQRGRLRLQYRMRGAIGELVGKVFYRGELSADLNDHEDLPFGDLSLAGLRRRVTWYDTSNKGRGAIEEWRDPSYVNAGEIQTVVSLLKRIALVLGQRPASAAKPTIGVISGYAAQVYALDREIRRQPELSSLSIECSSVHTFQGREVDICIYSVTRNNDQRDFGFLSDWRHLNVALSRARWYLAIVGSLPFCSAAKGDNPFKDVVAFVTADAGCEVKECPDG